MSDHFSSGSHPLWGRKTGSPGFCSMPRGWRAVLTEISGSSWLAGVYTHALISKVSPPGYYQDKLGMGYSPPQNCPEKVSAVICWMTWLQSS